MKHFMDYLSLNADALLTKIALQILHAILLKDLFELLPIAVNLWHRAGTENLMPHFYIISLSVAVFEIRQIFKVFELHKQTK